MTFSPPNTITAFLPQSEVFPEDQSQNLIKMTSVYTRVANAVNIREIGVYDTDQVVDGQLFFDPNDAQKKRVGFRTVYPIGAIASGSTLTFAHELENVTLFTRVYGTCITNVVDNRPIPYVDVTNVTNQVGIRVTSTNVIVSNGATAPAITSGIVILEYLLS